MKTLAEHNKQRAEQHEELRLMQEPHPNGIACPECGSELWDSCPMVTLPTNPLQKNVHCQKCGWSGYRLA